MSNKISYVLGSIILLFLLNPNCDLIHLTLSGIIGFLLFDRLYKQGEGKGK